MQSSWVFFTPSKPNCLPNPPTPNNGLVALNCSPHVAPIAAMAQQAPSIAIPAAAAAAAAAAGPTHPHPHFATPAAFNAPSIVFAASPYGHQPCVATNIVHPHHHSRPHPFLNPSHGTSPSTAVAVTPRPPSTIRVKLENVPMGSSGMKRKCVLPEEPDNNFSKEIKKAKLETKALKAKRPGFTDERYNETSYYVENGLRKVYPYYFTFTTFTKGRWVGEKILDVFAREFRAHPVEEYERCIKSGTLTVNYTKVDTDYRLKHNDLLANIVHRHEVPVTAEPIKIIYQDEDLVVVNKPASIPVHPCGRYRHNTVVFILAKEYQLKNLRTIHRLDRLTSGLLLFGRSPKKARDMEQQIRNRQVQKEYVCRVEGMFPDEEIECSEPIEVVSYKIGVCKVSSGGKECKTMFKKMSSDGKTSVVIARPKTGRMHQIRVHLQYLGFPIVNDPLYNHTVFGPEKGKGGRIGKSDEELIAQLISIHNAENWLGIEGDDGSSASPDFFGTSMSRNSCEQGRNRVEGGDEVMETNSSRDKSPTTKEGENEEKNEGSIKSRSSAVDGKDGYECEGMAERTGKIGGSECSSVRMKTVEVSPDVIKEAAIKVTSEKESTVQNNCISNCSSVGKDGKVTVGTQTCEESRGSNRTYEKTGCLDVSETKNSGITESNTEAKEDSKNSLSFRSALMTYDQHCYECKVRYRDPKPKDLIMYLHAIKYKGPDWCYETSLPAWASEDWTPQEEPTA